MCGLIGGGVAVLEGVNEYVGFEDSYAQTLPSVEESPSSWLSEEDGRPLAAFG